jgi:AcrR family transcriptional regulator
MVDLKDIKLKKFVKDKTKEVLLKTGRKLVVENGVDALSARKLANSANSSVGMVYNIFGTMDNYIAEQNIITLTELYEKMKKVVLSKNPFNNLNHYADVLTAYIEANPNLWHLFYTSQLSVNTKRNSLGIARIIKKIDILISSQALQLIKGIGVKEKRLVIKVLEMSLFALSGYLLGNGLNAKSELNRGSLCKLLMNTYMAGLATLGKVN